MEAFGFYDFDGIKLGIAAENDAVTQVFFDSEKRIADGKVAEPPVICRAAMQLAEYFDGARKTFDIPLLLRGTKFQQSVWAALQTIPFGETCSYQDIAVSIGNPKAVRAVGMANHRNPIAIIVPCHRVIGRNGGLTGYAGGLSLKKRLLDLEHESCAAGSFSAGTAS